MDSLTTRTYSVEFNGTSVEFIGTLETWVCEMVTDGFLDHENIINVDMSYIPQWNLSVP